MLSTVARLALRPLPLVAAIALVVFLAPGQLQGATTWVVSFGIDDTFPPAKVTSDVGAPYEDYRLQSSSCVEADLSASSFFATLNRKIDAAGTRCNPAGSERQFHVHLTAAPQACQKLAAAYTDGVLFNNPATTSECDLIWTANPRIRIPDLFKAGKNPSTAVALLNDKVGDDGLSYEIQALTNVPIAAPSANRRELTYDGQGMLLEFAPSKKAKFVAEAFDLDFHMVFDRVAR